jgi:hypothetical protein
LNCLAAPNSLLKGGEAGSTVGIRKTTLEATCTMAITTPSNALLLLQGIAKIRTHVELNRVTCTRMILPTCCDDLKDLTHRIGPAPCMLGDKMIGCAGGQYYRPGSNDQMAVVLTVQSVYDRSRRPIGRHWLPSSCVLYGAAIPCYCMHKPTCQVLRSSATARSLGRHGAW